MKITKYIQSCLLITHGGTKVLIDPGDGLKDLDGIPSDFEGIDAILYTHQHADHYDADILVHLKEKNPDVLVYANGSHAELIGGIDGILSVEPTQIFDVGSLGIRTVAIEHCLMPDGSEGPENVGYVINETFFHPGDGIYLEGETVPHMALPITGPDVSMKDAFAFANQLGVQTAIPIHYDKLGAFPAVYKEFAERFSFDFSIKVLDSGQSLELIP